jgi:hypothetical protein
LASQALVAVGGELDDEALRLQSPAHRASERSLVVDQQDPHASRPRVVSPLLCGETIRANHYRALTATPTATGTVSPIAFPPRRSRFLVPMVGPAGVMANHPFG